MQKILSVLLGIFMLTICFAGCTGQPFTPTPVSTPVPVSTEPPMVFPVGVEWRLTSYLNGTNGMTRVVGEKPVTVRFDTSGTLSGSGGCNQYSAIYKVTGTSISVNSAHNNRDGMFGTDYAPGKHVLCTTDKSIQL